MRMEAFFLFRDHALSLRTTYDSALEHVLNRNPLLPGGSPERGPAADGQPTGGPRVQAGGLVAPV